VREAARFARKSGESVSDAKKEMGAFYDKMEAQMKKGPISGDGTLALRTEWASIMEKYKPKTRDAAAERRYLRSLEFSSGLHMAYLQSHQALMAMGEARGKTSKSLWNRKVSTPLIGKLTDASIGFENSRVGQALGKIPFVRRAVALPTKALDPAVQLRGSRMALKAIRGEMLGQVATMLGQTRLGRPVYNAFRSAHVAGDGSKTRFGKAYTFITGRDWGAFEKKHDLSAKRLVEYYDAIARMRQQGMDVHNLMFDQISAKLIDALPLRANAMQQAEMQKILKAMGMKGEDIARLGNSAALDALFAKLQEGTNGSRKSRELMDRLAAAMTDGAGSGLDRKLAGSIDRKLERLQESINRELTGEDRKNANALLAHLKASIVVERGLASVLADKAAGNDPNRTQGSVLDRLIGLVEKHSPGENIGHLREAVALFKENEKTLRANALVVLGGKNYYQIAEKEHIRSDIAAGMSDEKLRAKYGSDIVALTENRELLRQLLGVREATTGERLKMALDGLMDRIGLASLTSDERRMLSQLSADYGDRKQLSSAQMAKIAAKMDAMDNLRKVVDGRVFGQFNAKEAAMKDWVLKGGSESLIGSHARIADIFKNRLDELARERAREGNSLELHEIVREGCVLGRNPLELVIEKAIRDVITEKAAKSKSMSPEAAGKLADEMLAFMAGKNGKMKDMDALEQFFKLSAKGEAHTDKFAGFLRSVAPDGSLKAETLFKSAMVQVNEFAREWSARNYAAIGIMHGSQNAGGYMANYSNALKELLSNSTIKTSMAYAKGEKEFYQQEMGYSEYRKFGLSSAIFTARTWEKMFGFIVSSEWGGSSRGEQVLHHMDSAYKSYAEALGRYAALYRNLRSSESVFYDKNFKAGDGKTLDLEAYEALLKRGYTWQDKKNGLEILMSVDRKSTPMILTGRYLEGGQTEIVKTAEANGGKADIRNYARLLANTMGSYYSTREVGFVVLVNKDGKWVYGDPFLDKLVQKDVGDADKKITRRQEIMDDMISKGAVKVVSTKDFMTYSKDRNYKDFFGEYNRMDRAREGLRSALYKPGMLYGEFVYGAYSDRMEGMMRWYAAQWQVRQTLDRLAHTIKDEREGEEGTIKGMMGGADRFKFSEKSIDRIYSNADVPNLHASDEVRDRLAREMKYLSEGRTGTFADSAKAWYHNWHGRMASNIMGELGAAESDLFNARLASRALERLYERGERNGGIGIAEYDALQRVVAARTEELKGDYKKAKDEYMDLNRDMIGWVGSKGRFTYEPQRTIWNLGIAGRLLDSRHVQGTQDAFYQISESSVMRDPRVAIGASAPGWEHSYYVGYHTGQNVYERTRYWATNSLWEKQMHLSTDIVYTVHKWWNDRMSFFARYTSGYPATVKSDMMYAPEYQPRSTKDYFKALLVIMPFQSRTYSDYFRARWQDAISYSGAGHMLAAYQSLGNVGRYDTPGEGEEKRSWLKRQIDKFGMESEHYTGMGGTPFRIASQQRSIDQVMKFDAYIDNEGRNVNVRVDGADISLAAARDKLKLASARADGEEEEKYAHGISDALGAVANLKDRRGRYVRDVFSGSDIQEDGSRNRFLDMYLMFHSNVFMPTIPGMLHASPIGKGEWHTFPQVAHEVDKAEDRTRLGAMKNYWQAGYDADAGRITFSDQFTTRQDAVAEAYRNDVPVLMHLMKMQNKEIGYSVLNAPQMAYVNPIWFGLGRKIYKTAISHTPGMEAFTSTFHEPVWKLPGQSMVERQMARRRGELPAGTLDEDYRKVIYGSGIATEAVLGEAEKSSGFFKRVRDSALRFRLETKPGGKTSKKYQKAQVEMLAGD